MIRSFGNKATEDIFDGVNSREARRIPVAVWKVTERKLGHINAATSLNDLAAIPGNRLEKLHGDMEGFYGVRVNDQSRIVFQWSEGNADKVRITDYH